MKFSDLEFSSSCLKCGITTPTTNREQKQPNGKFIYFMCAKCGNTLTFRAKIKNIECIYFGECKNKNGKYCPICAEFVKERLKILDKPDIKDHFEEFGI